VNSDNRTSLGVLNSNGGLLLPCDLDRKVFFQLQNSVGCNRYSVYIFKISAVKRKIILL